MAASRSSNLPRTIAKARALQNESLTVRFNPHLPIELDVAGASVRITGGEAGARLRVAGVGAQGRHPARAAGPRRRVLVRQGDARPERVLPDLGGVVSVKVSLLAGTGVPIHARNRMGKVVLPTGLTKGDMVDPGIRDASWATVTAT